MSDVIDKQTLYDQVGDDPELLLTVVEMFLEDARTLLQSLTEGIAQQDPVAVERGAHRLKGSLLTFGAQPAAHAAMVLERMGREKNLNGADAGYETLAAELARLEPELTALTRQ